MKRQKPYQWNITDLFLWGSVYFKICFC